MDVDNSDLSAPFISYTGHKNLSTSGNPRACMVLLAHKIEIDGHSANPAGLYDGCARHFTDEEIETWSPYTDDDAAALRTLIHKSTGGLKTASPRVALLGILDTGCIFGAVSHLEAADLNGPAREVFDATPACHDSFSKLLAVYKDRCNGSVTEDRPNLIIYDPRYLLSLLPQDETPADMTRAEIDAQIDEIEIKITKVADEAPGLIKAKGDAEHLLLDAQEAKNAAISEFESKNDAQQESENKLKAHDESKPPSGSSAADMMPWIKDKKVLQDVAGQCEIAAMEASMKLEAANKAESEARSAFDQCDAAVKANEEVLGDLHAQKAKLKQKIFELKQADAAAAEEAKKLQAEAAAQEVAADAAVREDEKVAHMASQKPDQDEDMSASDSEEEDSDEEDMVVETVADTPVAVNTIDPPPFLLEHLSTNMMTALHGPSEAITKKINAVLHAVSSKASHHLSEADCRAFVASLGDEDGNLFDNIIAALADLHHTTGIDDEVMIKSVYNPIQRELKYPPFDGKVVHGRFREWFFDMLNRTVTTFTTRLTTNKTRNANVAHFAGVKRVDPPPPVAKKAPPKKRAKKNVKVRITDKLEFRGVGDIDCPLLPAYIDYVNDKSSKLLVGKIMKPNKHDIRAIVPETDNKESLTDATTSATSTINACYKDAQAIERGNEFLKAMQTMCALLIRPKATDYQAITKVFTTWSSSSCRYLTQNKDKVNQVYFGKDYWCITYGKRISSGLHEDILRALAEVGLEMPDRKATNEAIEAYGQYAAGLMSPFEGDFVFDGDFDNMAKQVCEKLPVLGNAGIAPLELVRRIITVLLFSEVLN